ncbi:MAG: hypothetical protein CBD58_05135 [bacterium TMED198]|nr:MAG: hypothetical protein CBD58_05135 [bacterium TMED198]|tara:strand:+ start:210 stop:893 length:684 start_codon:yes stop_codon:yes gene_type:complete
MASESNEYNRSFRVSSIAIWFLVLFEIFLIVLSAITIKNAFDKDSMLYEIINLRSYKNHMTGIANDVGALAILDSLKYNDKFLINYFEENKKIYPKVAPVSGYVSQGLILDDIEKKHFGIDVVASKKEKVLSAAEGMVVFNGIDSELGKVLVISHPNDFYTLYGHLDTIFVDNREIINANSVIALVGTTGVTSGPHLHFEIWKGNELIDPRDVIEEYRRKDVSIRKQ